MIPLKLNFVCIHCRCVGNWWSNSSSGA